MLSALVVVRVIAAVPDTPFKQAVAVRTELAPELQGTGFQRLALDHNGVAYVLTDKGVARLFDHRLALDLSFRPLAGRLARDITLLGGNLYYLFDDEMLSNAHAGVPFARLPAGVYRHFALAADGTVLLSGATNLAFYGGGQLTVVPFAIPRADERLYAWGNEFFVLTTNAVYRVAWPRIGLFLRGTGLTALAFRGTQAWVGTHAGYYGVDLVSGQSNIPLQTRLPATDITCLAATANGLWAGTTRGVFAEFGRGQFRYFASRRWLDDDTVVDLHPGANGDLYVLTRAGLNKIEFRAMTLAQKAAYYDQKVRQRHIRYGLCAELRLRQPGDIASAEMIDTDNDGSWSSYYLASQAFRYAVTGEEEARANAWETFDALERLQTINGLDGFPARTFERRGFKVSDPERWRVAPDPNWEWKGHTSSDEITAQTFAYAVLLETTARTPAERERIATDYDRMLGHIVRHDLYLVDVDGKPTLWGRWNPEYVNRYPPTIEDRRLNSAEIVAFLQFGYRVTGKEAYRRQALELLDRYGYLRNITNTLRNIRFTSGYVYQGNDMGSEWNHSDDLLAFINDWTLYRYALTPQLRRDFAAAIRDRWEIEAPERCPLWDFIYAMTGAPVFDLEGALWTLQRYPLDLTDWTIVNSARRDLTRLPDNFRKRQSEQLLAPDERPTMRWNGNPFTLDGGNGGLTELAGDEFLLPYWLGRYLRLLQ